MSMNKAAGYTGSNVTQSLELGLRSAGMRSQSSQQMRHISGLNYANGANSLLERVARTDKQLPTSEPGLSRAASQKKRATTLQDFMNGSDSDHESKRNLRRPNPLLRKPTQQHFVPPERAQSSRPTQQPAEQTMATSRTTWKPTVLPEPTVSSTRPLRQSTAISKQAMSSGGASVTTSAHQTTQDFIKAHNEGVVEQLARFGIQEFMSRPSEQMEREIARENTFRAELEAQQAANTELQHLCLKLRNQLSANSLEATELKKVVQQLQLDLVRSQNDKRALEQELSAVQAGNDHQERLCIICMANEASHAVIPCGHLIFCEACENKCTSSCPVCRETIEKKLRIFKM